MQPEPAPIAVVRRTLHVQVPIERAFELFTARMGDWWPPTHHIAKTPFREVIVEPRAGGRWFERDADGAECLWGSVLLWEPPRKAILSWKLQADWSFDPDLNRASEVVLNFVAESDTSTRLDFEHRGLERHGAGAERVFTGVNSPGGWTSVLAEYVHLASR